MATKTKVKRGDTSPSVIIPHVTVRPIERRTQDIHKWRMAMLAAESTTKQRTMLYDLYEDILLDGHLWRQIEKRIIAVTNADITFTVDNVAVPEIVALSNTPAFEQLLRHIMEAKFWGYSLIELQWAAMGADGDNATYLIPRKHVKPELGIVTQNPYDLSGIDYSTYLQVCVRAGDASSLGEILRACQYVIYKRGNFGDWAEYAELFGMPFRFAKYNNEQTRTILVEELNKVGSAGAMVAPSDAELDFKSADSGQGNTVFGDLRKACNEEISITILGETMSTTEAQHGGFAQAAVQAAAGSELFKADRRYVERTLNQELNRVLAALGYPVQGGTWRFEDIDTLSLKDRVDIDLKIAAKLPVSKKYFYEKYKLPMPEDADDILGGDSSNADIAADTADTTTAEKKKLSSHYSQAQAIRLYYADSHRNTCGCKDCKSIALDFSNRFTKIPSDLVSNYVEQYYENIHALKGNAKSQLFHAYNDRLVQFAEAGYGKSFSVFESMDDFKKIAPLKVNLARFSTHKINAINTELAAIKKAAKTQSDYTKKATALLNRHHHYLRTECVTAMSAAQSAESWHEYQQRADIYPNLKYITAHDERVRHSHKVLHNKVYPLSHPFWEVYYPPNGWRCRCKTIQTDEPVDMLDALPEIDATFRNNPGITGKLFNDNHPYFKIDKNVRIDLNMEADKYVSKTDVKRRKLEDYEVLKDKDLVFKTDKENLNIKLTTSGIKSIYNHTHPIMQIATGIIQQLDKVENNTEFKYLGKMFNDDIENKPNKGYYFYFQIFNLLGYDFILNIEEYKNFDQHEYRLYAITENIHNNAEGLIPPEE